ncbi:hypothetical protein CR513_07553, partial [Mucuna pruriens]
MENVRYLEEVEFEKEENIRNVVFNEKFVNDIGQVLVPITVQDDIGLTEDDPINFYQVMQSSNSQKWIDAMKDEMKSMQDNVV